MTIQIIRGNPRGLGLYASLEGYDVVWERKTTARNLLAALRERAEHHAIAKAATGVGRADVVVDGARLGYVDCMVASTVADAQRIIDRLRSA